MKIMILNTLTNQVIPKDHWKTIVGNNYGCSWSNRLFWWLLYPNRNLTQIWLKERMIELKVKVKGISVKEEIRWN